MLAYERSGYGFRLNAAKKVVNSSKDRFAAIERFTAPKNCNLWKTFWPCRLAFQRWRGNVRHRYR